MGKNPNTFYSLQACRGIAACLVSIYHFSYSSKFFLGVIPFHSFFLFGHAGVDFFFVLSGFIIAFVHQNDIGHPSALRSYLLKRIIRIYPIYWPVLIAVTIAYLMFSNYNRGFDESSLTWVYFFKSFFLVEYSKRPIVDVAWTLVYEIFFYISFCTLIFNKRLGLSVFGLWAIFVTVNFVVPFKVSNGFLIFILSYHNLEFLMGCLSAWIIIVHSNFIKKPFLLFSIAAFLFLVNGVMEVYYGDLNNIIKISYGICSFLIILGLVKTEKTENIRTPRFLVLLGSASYCIYLTHNFVISISYRFCSKIMNITPVSMHIITVNMMSMLVLVITVSVGIAYYKFYERPVLQYIRKKLLK